jgi:hypothetical protein
MKINQKGFGVIEILLSIIALSLVVGVGYYVYDQRNSSDTNKATTTSNTTTPASTDTKAEKKIDIPTPEKEYVELKNIGLKIVKSGEIANMSFKTVADSPSTYFVRHNKIDELLKKCSGGSGADASSHAFMSVRHNEGTYDENDNTSGPRELIKQFEGYYITAGYPNGSQCGGAKEEVEARKLFFGFQSEVSDAIKNAEEL